VNKLAVIVMLLGLVACSRKKPEEGREPAQTSAPAVVGSAAPSPAAPAGSAAGTAVASAEVSCATAATVTCGADQADGCTTGLTAVHVCVAKDAKAGPPCAQQQALSCPAGQVDACLHDPPKAPTHLCVVAKAAP
jgi:hypothetical protein